MRIAQVTAIDDTMKNFIDPLNSKLKEEGHEVHCICSEGPNAELLRNKGYHLHQVHIDRSIHPIKNIKSIINMAKVFSKIKPDIVHVHTPVAAVLGRIAAKISKVPNVIYTAHGFYFHDGMSRKQYQLFFNIEKYVGRWFTDYIFTQSIEDYHVAQRNHFLKQQDHYVHIGNGIDLKNKFNVEQFDNETKKKIRKQYGFQDNDIIVTFIGRLVEEKGIFDFLESKAFLKHKNVKFLVLGGVPQGERDTKTFEALERFRNRDDIIFTGHVSGVNELLYASDIFCLPSYREGMPRSIIEAMAMENVILATNIRGSREEVLHGKTGYLFPIKSKKIIASYIDMLVENPELLSQMQKENLKRAYEHFNEMDVIDKQLQVFEQCK